MLNNNTNKYFIILNKLRIIIITLFIILQFYSCKKDNSFSKEDFIGKWELEELVIDDHDTTAFIKADSNCYGYTNFLEDGRIGQIPVYSVGRNFHCAQLGIWSFAYERLIIDFGVSNVNVGPYLVGERMEWEILEISSHKMKLHILYQNMSCYLTYKK